MQSTRTRLLVLAIAASPLATAAAQDASLSLADLIEKSEPACVRIDVKYKNGSKGIGSGFVVDADRRWVVTNYHVVADSDSAAVSFSDKSTAEVEGWRAQYPEYDLTLLQIKTNKKLTALPIAADLPRKGEATVAIGTPQGLSFTATEGIVSAIRNGKELERLFTAGRTSKQDDSIKKPIGTWLQTSTPISPGSSGGPLLNRKGEVIGANSGSLASAQNINFAVSCVQIQKLVNIGRKIRLRELTTLIPSSETWLRDGVPETPAGEKKNIVIKIPAERRFRHRYDIEKDEDEFDKVTVLRTEWLPVKHDNRQLTSLGVRVSIVFDEKEILPLAIWEVGATARQFQFLRREDSRIQVLGGDDSYELPQGKPERKVQNGGTSEILKGLTALDAFVKIVLNDKVKARVGSTEMEFDRRQIECLRDLASQIPVGKFYDGKLTIEHMTKEEDPTLGGKR